VANVTTFGGAVGKLVEVVLSHDEIARLLSLRARISALLPPPETL
jgi:hypothetical protein